MLDDNSQLDHMFASRGNKVWWLVVESESFTEQKIVWYW